MFLLQEILKYKFEAVVQIWTGTFLKALVQTWKRLVEYEASWKASLDVGN